MDEEIEEGMLIEDETEPPPQESETGKISPYEMLRESKSSVEEIVTKMLSIKKHGEPKTQLRELVTQMFLHFVTLRQANRSILLEEDRVKAETERAKAPVDFTTLQLNNLMYEKSHYVKAIKACKDFKSKYPDIELVSEDEFFRDAPEDIKNSIRSKDSAHNLMLQRLDYELFQRKELCKRRDELEQHKKSLLEVIANRKKFLSSLPSHLKSLKKASLPVQNQLGMLQTKKLKQHQLAELLPPPLYVIYSQFLAQKEAFGENIELEIVGSVKDAQAFARHQANKDAGASTNVESSKLEDDAPDEDDDGQRRRKRPKKIPAKVNIEHAGIYQVHPLKIILHIYDNETCEPKSMKLLSLKFECLSKLNIICVGIEGSHEGPENNILCNLFPDDTGLELPHQSAKLVVRETLSFSDKRTSRPYKWAQHLAGIDFLPELPPLVSAQESASGETVRSDIVSGLSMYRQQNRIQTVVQRLRSRKKAQLALVEQLDSLEKLKWPVLTCDNVPWASHKPSCSLQGWSLVGYATSQESSLNIMEKEKVRDPLDVDMLGKSGISREDIDGAREDGELPALVSSTSILDNAQPTPLRTPNLEHSKQLTLISKSITPQTNYSRMLSFSKHDEDYELMLDVDSDQDEPMQTELAADDVASIPSNDITRKTWMDYGSKEYCLVMTRNTDSPAKNLKLQAKIKISMEYPLRPPFFTLNLYTINSEENRDESDDSDWYNELRAMEAEVNLHILNMLPLDQENYILSHQICCLEMLFNYCINEASRSSERKKSSFVIDVGLCKPVSGSIHARSFRGRDRRKMISWKDIECAPGYPC
ncbi:THO complex subunit 5B [Cucurbita maxima]|uniref:THO complex subunit 5B n=1 Tax=Cucurbita maxima TaxID=3661 RepID=A0A6J1J206_CUCMA|nr:THO complex subunit 5B [Cucurbita maxima]